MPTYKRPRLVDDDTLESLEQLIGLNTPNEEFRDDVYALVIDYYWATQHGAPLESAVRKRLDAIRRSALKLRDLLRGSPAYHRRRKLAKAVFHEEFAKFSDMDSFMAATADVAKGSKKRKKEIVLLGTVEGIVTRAAGIDAWSFGKALEKISQPALMFKSKGGRPAKRALAKLQFDLGRTFEKWTRKRPSVTEGDYKKERYSGDFVKFVAIVDRDVARGQGEEPRKNSALGPALRRQTKRVNKTPAK